jgi:AraC family transcriptional regulator, transcriptional activator of pobA
VIIRFVPEDQSDSLVKMRRSLVSATATRRSGRRVGAAPLYEYVRAPGAPPVSVLRFSAHELPEGAATAGHGHAHDFLVVAYFEQGGGRLGLGERWWPLAAGDAFVIAPGEVVRLDEDEHGAATGWCVFFAPELITSEALGGSLGWRSHPLLFPLLGPGAGGGHRLAVPAAQRAVWSRHAAAIEDELRVPREGSGEAALAHLTLLLVSASRLSVDVGRDLRLQNQPLLARVFEFIEEHYRAPISLATVAADVGLTPGHLTTVVRRRTGRSVQRWITERRMAEARRLLRETDRTVEAIAGEVGYADASYFIKHFRRHHGMTPAVWRRELRGAARRDLGGFSAGGPARPRARS